MKPTKRRYPSGRMSNRRTSNIDMEEIRPHQFMVYDERIRPTLKGEGEIKGQLFVLTSWRRDGLMARLRAQGYTVRTLADQVGRLPNLPEAVRVGGEVRRPITNVIDRYAYFDTLALAWVPLEPQELDGTQAVVLRDGWVIRRRRGRGAPSYHRVFAEPAGTAGLRPITETDALMAGYAMAAAAGPRELLVRQEGKEYRLPDVVLPKPFADTLSRFARQNGPGGWLVLERGLPLSQELFSHLGLLLRIID